MFYLHDVGPQHGALEVLPWQYSLKVFRSERTARRQMRTLEGCENGDRRQRQLEILQDYYDEKIGAGLSGEIVQPTGPAGTVVAFMNNCIHRGGFPDPDIARYAILFHCYPADTPVDLERYRSFGLRKVVPYPQDPAAEL